MPTARRGAFICILTSVPLLFSGDGLSRTLGFFGTFTSFILNLPSYDTLMPAAYFSIEMWKSLAPGEIQFENRWTLILQLGLFPALQVRQHFTLLLSRLLLALA